MIRAQSSMLLVCGLFIRLPQGNWRMETERSFSRPSQIPATRLEDVLGYQPSAVKLNKPKPLYTVAHLGHCARF